MTVDERPIIGIYPQFCLMRNGALAMIWGRCGYGVGTAVAFSLDGTGRSWTGMTPLPFNTGMNDIAEIEPDVLLVSGAKALDEKWTHWELQMARVTVERI